MSSTSHPVPPRGHFVSILMLLVVLIAVLLISSCGRPKQPRVNVPPPPPPESTTGTPAPSQPAPKTTKPAESATPPKPTEEADLAEPVIPAGTKPIETQTGLASWYGPPYHNRRGSNGEIYNMHAMTAAHRTFPLGSIARVNVIPAQQFLSKVWLAESYLGVLRGLHPKPAFYLRDKSASQNRPD